MKISLRDKLNILLVGIITSVLVFFMIQVAFATILIDFIVGHISDYAILFLIILGFELLVLVISVIVSFWLTESIEPNSVYKSVLMAFISNLIFLIIVSYLGMFISFPETFSGITGFEIILIFPAVFVNFAIYIMGEVIYFFMLSVISYYIFLVLFLEQFYKYKSKYN